MDKRQAKAIRLYRSGLPTREVADVVGADDHTVRRWLRLGGIEVRRRGARPTSVTTAEIEALVTDGMSLRQIAAEVGMSPSGVRNRLNRAIADKVPLASDDEVIALRESGASWAELGRACGMSASGARWRYLRLRAVA